MFSQHLRSNCNPKLLSPSLIHGSTSIILAIRKNVALYCSTIICKNCMRGSCSEPGLTA